MWIRAVLLGLIACGERNDSLAADTPKGEAPAAEAAAPATPPPPAPKQAAIPSVVAEVAGQQITWDEVFASSASDLIAAEVALNEAQRNAVDALVTQKLLEAEAKKQGKPVEVYVQEAMAKAPMPTEAEARAFYDQNQAQMPGSFEQMRPQLEAYLQQQQGSKVLQELVAKLKAENAVKVSLPSYRVSVDATGPRKGPATAPVQIIEFSDFQCPYCSMAAETVEEVVKKYGDKVSVVYRHFPLPMHAQAERAAQASMCANDQGGFWKFHDALFAERKAWTDEDFKGYAKKSGLNAKKFDDCLQKGTHEATVKADMEAGQKVGMNGTPGFYVNGIVLTGARPLEDFVAIIDAELAKQP